MTRGFIFDTGKCTGCGACTAACSLMNGWNIKPRNIYWWNREMRPGIPVFSVSLACNHCEEAACLRGCPTGAYSRIEGAVVMDTDKCIGCKYCIWNCPYDAPSYESETGVVGKCHSCHTLVAEGERPACASGCPTGALSYGWLRDAELKPDWFPGTGLKPAISFKESNSVVEVYPASKFPGSKVREKSHETGRSSKNDWSLVSFTFLSLLSVSIVFSSLFTGNINEAVILAMLAVAGLSSFFHLGKPGRSWRSIRNLVKSPLSREIMLFLAFSVFTIMALFTSINWPLVIASITGLALLAAIDLVYIMPDKKVIFHSGQVFIAGLMLIAMMTGELLPFSFIAILRIYLSSRLIAFENNNNYQRLRFVRIALLAIAWTGWLTGVTHPGWMLFILIFAGELADRILFYHDFKPSTLREFFKKHYTEYINEKERSKQRPHPGLS